MNLPAILNRAKAELKMGSHRNVVLQEEWHQFGPEMFEFEELELLDPSDDPEYDATEDLHTLEELWLEKLSPFAVGKDIIGHRRLCQTVNRERKCCEP